MAKAFKPYVRYTNEKGELKGIEVPTYSEVKRKMKEFIKDSIDENVAVYRHKRGEWGEWFEFWGKVGNKCEINKQGWM